jgi:hypothetical protein
MVPTPLCLCFYDRMQMIFLCRGEDWQNKLAEPPPPPSYHRHQPARPPLRRKGRGRPFVLLAWMQRACYNTSGSSEGSAVLSLYAPPFRCEVVGGEEGGGGGGS